MKLMNAAWRNIGRNKGRTILSATAIFFSALIICLAISLEEGFINDMKTNVTNHLTGDISIKNSEYVKNERISPLQFFIEHTEKVIAAIEDNPLVETATPKSDFGVSIYRGGEQIPSRAMGIDFTTSRIISSKANKLVAGTLPEKGSSQVLVAAGLARELKLEIGSRFTAITRTAISGSNGKTFTVSGIIALADTDFANRVFFMDWHTAGEYLRMNSNALQIQVFLKKSGATGGAATDSLRKTLENENITGLDVTVWHQVSSIYQFFALAGMIYAVIGGIFYAIASTVIFNTTMMSVLERKKEIGTLRALGMESRSLVTLFLLESGMIAAIGAFAGTATGYLLVSLIGRVGLDFSVIGGNSLKGLSVSQVIYPALNTVNFLLIFIMGIAISLAACFIPARMALPCGV